MTSQTPVLSPASHLLRRVLMGNSVFSTVTAILLLIFATPIAELMGVDSSLPFTLVGVGLLPFAGSVFYLASRPRIPFSQVRVVIVMDLAWVLGSGILLLTNAFSITSSGRVLIAFVAVAVLAFAVGQSIGLRHLHQVTG